MIDVVLEILELNIAAAAAIGLMLVARGQVRRRLGPGAAYLMWTIVPVAMLATLVPSRTILVASQGRQSGELWDAVLSPAMAGVVLTIWIAGAVAMIAFVVNRQRLFLRDVELGLAGPAVVGFFYSSIVTPSDFAERFNANEQKLILAHEQVHIERCDARINAVVALGRCLMWFNPLVHAGAKAFHADQELSCDAAVVERRPKARRIYAETLLKTQLASRPLPVGCYWPADEAHPLTERVAMLTRSPFSHGRRLAAAGAVLVLVGGGGVAAWAAQPAREVLVSTQDVFVTFQPIVSARTPGLRVRLLPGSSFRMLSEPDGLPDGT